MATTNAFKLNPGLQAQWKGAIAELASIRKASDPQSVQKLVTQSARRFVKNVVDITPPATGKADTSAKKRGENAIITDLLKIAIPTQTFGGKASREGLANATELIERHARAFSKGDVPGGDRKNKLFVAQAEFNRAAKSLMARVGWLAAGLNAAATRIGFSLPAWIRRHGSRFGKIEVTARPHGLRVRVIQNVPFADDVAGYSRRWNFALQKEINSIRNQANAIFDRKAARAKARLRR